MGVQILTISVAESGFLASRAAGISALPPQFEYVLPMQEDFLLDRSPDYDAIQESISIFEKDETVGSIRWMPCPGPSAADKIYKGTWRTLDPKNDEYLFIFQATLWRRAVVQKWYLSLVKQFSIDYAKSLSDEERRTAEIRANYAENRRGQQLFASWFCADVTQMKHIAWIRRHASPNAVYLSPWPYRPTAVVGGKLEEWAIELGKREGYPLL
jgi:hypothetical protein